MNKNKIIRKSEQLSLNFDIVTVEDYSFQIKEGNKFSFTEANNCKVIKFDSYKLKNEIELRNRFFSLSDHLD